MSDQLKSKIIVNCYFRVRFMEQYFNYPFLPTKNVFIIATSVVHWMRLLAMLKPLVQLKKKKKNSGLDPKKT